MARRVADLYVHMTRIFGNAWTARYGDTDDGVWRAVLSQLDREEVKRGLRHMLNDWRDSFPPTPGQFIGVARIPPAQRPFDRSRQLAHLASDEETAKAGIEELRRVIE